MFEQHGVQVDVCVNEDRFIYLSMLENYTAVILIHQTSHEILVNCYSRWKNEGCSSLFVVLTGNQSALERAWCLEAGVDYYIIEPYSYVYLLQIVTAHAYKQQAREKENFQTSCFELDILSRVAKCNGVHLELTKVQFDILAYFIRRRGVVLSRVQIWEEVWGYEEYPLGNVIDVHIARLRKKLPEGYDGLIKTVYGVGYRMHELA